MFSKTCDTFLKIVNKSTRHALRQIFDKSAQTSSELMAKEKQFLAHNYDPIKVVIAKGKGCKVWDVEGKEYLDFLAGYAAVQVGHCHPKIIQIIKEQSETLTHVSRAYYNNILPHYGEYITKYFNYEKVLPMNTGVEAGETAVKIARRWSYKIKGVPENQALIVFPEGNFWGRTIAAVSTSTKPDMYEGFGPFMPGFGLVPYNDLCALEQVFKNPNVAAFYMEPIQGEAGVVIPSEKYLQGVRNLCTQYNVLWIADEIQTGLGRTGKIIACDHECVRPDLLILGKGLGGGMVPVSAVLGNDNVMCVMNPGSHGSTFGGNPLGSRLAIATLSILQDECLVENAVVQGEKFRNDLTCNLPTHIVSEIRGKGLMNAIVICPGYGKAGDICSKLKDNGLLAKHCDDTVIRFTPPLTVTDAEITRGIDIIYNTIANLQKVQ